MRPLRTLVVDDSAFNRKRISEIIGSVEGVSVVGKAANGEEALRMLGSLDPDLIMLDLEMPKMDGFSFLRFVMARRPIPVIVVSSHSGKQDVFRALELGALDFVAKPGAAPGEKLDVIREELINKVEMVQRLRPALPDKAEGRRTVSTVLRAIPKDDTRPLPRQDTPRRLVVIVASTGGPSALVEVFSTFRSTLPVAVLVVQHMPARFTRTFAERLDRLGGLRVTEAVDGDRLRAGRALVCPGGKCAEVVRASDGLALRIDEPRPSDRYVPFGDRVLDTAAKVIRSRLVAVVLTGMGDDGAAGVRSAKAVGGTVIIQEPGDALIDGMPRCAKATGAVDFELPLGSIAERIVTLSER